ANDARFGIGTEPKNPGHVNTNVLGTDFTDPTVFSGFRFTSDDPELRRILDQRSFGSVEELAAQVEKYQQIQAQTKDFLNVTTVGLENFGKTTGSLNDQIAAITAQFAPAIETARQLASTNEVSVAQAEQLRKAEADLTATREESIQKARDAVNAQLIA